MKCAACGYIYKEKSQIVDDVVLYKTGKKKGQVKEIKTKKIKLVIGHSKFLEVYFSKGIENLKYEKEYFSYEPDLFACPECGTLKINIDNT